MFLLVLDLAADRIRIAVAGGLLLPEAPNGVRGAGL
jgi:hypothetical protein